MSAVILSLSTFFDNIYLQALFYRRTLISSETLLTVGERSMISAYGKQDMQPARHACQGSGLHSWHMYQNNDNIDCKFRFAYYNYNANFF